MSNESIFFTGRNALIVTLIAIALNPLSIFIGYYLSKQLSKPDINIKHVTHQIEYKKVDLRPELIETIKYNKYAFDQIKKHIFLNEYREIADENINMDIKKLFILLMKSPVMLTTNIVEGKLSYDFIIKAIRSKDAIFSDYKIKIDLIKENMKLVDSQLVFDSAVLKNVPDLEMGPVQEAGKRGPKYAHKLLEERLVKFLGEKDGLEIIIGEFENIVKQTKKERSGKINFEIGFLNEGDTDGVIFPQGEIIIDEKLIKIHQTQDSYNVIKPHSFEKNSFEINIDETPQAVLNNFKGLVLNNIPEEYEIVIKTSGGFAHSKERLPVD